MLPILDHGKSTLADRLLELTGTITKNAGTPRVLDKLKVEQERGITVKAQTASMIYRHTDGKEYLLNLVDTPGHVDFSYEVSRSLAACQGTILLVDAAQGIQAQTVSNFFLAFGENLAIVPVLNKVDLPGAEPDRVGQQIETAFEIPADDVLRISAKTGLGVEGVLAAVVERVPPPLPSLALADEGDGSGGGAVGKVGEEEDEMVKLAFRALLFDSWYDPFVGVVCLVAVRDGIVKKGDRIMSAHTKQSYEVTELGLMHPLHHRPANSLHAGQVGYLFLGMKTTRDAMIGDTFYALAAPTSQPTPTSTNPAVFNPNLPVALPRSRLALKGFRPAKSVVFSGVYPYDASEHPRLREALDRLTLNDASVTVAHETSTALGQGFRLGFLGTLHMDVFSQRLEEEHDAVVINTAPTVSYRVRWVREPASLAVGAGIKAEEEEMEVKIAPGRYKKKKVWISWIRNPAEFPEPDALGNVECFYEPMVIGTLIFPKDYLGTMMDLCGSHRGEQLDYTFIDETRVMLKYKLPMAEILTEFYDQLKSRTQGYASFDYEEIGYEEADLVKVNLLLNSKPVDALATICHKSQAERVAKEWVKKLRGVLDRQLVEIIIQAAINGRVVARESLSALRKDVTAKLYGGDVTRKMKLLEKQKAGKRRMKAVAGGIQLPQEAFLSLVGGSSFSKQGGAKGSDKPRK
ncbi:Translation factor guf1 mitochondrial [Phlyctochytrium bullatum]|nr:Translation factor guf1 mitochondrial [Phlyctochytrium bullatum]